MKGSIRKRGRSYTLTVDIGRDADGRRKQHFETFRTRREADAALANVLRQAQSGSYVKPSRLTVADYLRDWLNGREPHLRPQSFERYRFAIERNIAPSVGTILLSHLKPTDVQKMHRDALDAGLSPKSVTLLHRVLSQALKYAESWGMVDRNVARLAPPPKVARNEARSLDAKEALRLVEAVRATPYYALIALDLATGLRRGELLGLQWGDVDFERRSLRVIRSLTQTPRGALRVQDVKTDTSRRNVVLSPNAVLLLRAHREQAEAVQAVAGGQLRLDDFVFSHPTGKPFSPNHISKVFQRIARVEGLEGATLHSLRHTHASMLLDTGANLKDVSTRLGHSSIAITADIYAHPSMERQAEIAARFDEALSLPVSSREQSVSN